MAVRLHDLSGVNHVIRHTIAAAATAGTALTVIGIAPRGILDQRGFYCRGVVARFHHGAG